MVRTTEELRNALNTISEAARDQKDDLRAAIQEDYTNLVDVFQSGQERMSQVARKQMDRAKERAQYMDQKVHENPWPYLAGVATSSLLLGFIMGNTRTNSHKD